MNLLAYDEPLSEDPVYPPAQEPGTAVTASDRNASTLTALQAARLLEQLLQIARVSALE